ncbi:MAG TPA: double zinc ribbon domain-containing protein, partial [Longimicrobiaceae bacterium]|nr:double zinc ribbon domain-containing protein [Longimicrobiaceae bacterium]
MSVPAAVREAWAGALDLVFAPVCVGCRRPIATTDSERVVCRVCWARCRPVPSPRCPRCWGSLPTQTVGRDRRDDAAAVGESGTGSGVGSQDAIGRSDPWASTSTDAEFAAEAARRARRYPAVPCRACVEWPPYLRAVRSAFVMGDEVRHLVHALKYRGWQAAAAPMAARMAALPWPDDVGDEAQVVVPVPTTRTRLRERGYNQAASLARELCRAGRSFEPEMLVRTRQTGSQT